MRRRRTSFGAELRLGQAARCALAAELLQGAKGIAAVVDLGLGRGVFVDGLGLGEAFSP